MTSSASASTRWRMSGLSSPGPRSGRRGARPRPVRASSGGSGKRRTRCATTWTRRSTSTSSWASSSSNTSRMRSRRSTLPMLERSLVGKRESDPRDDSGYAAAETDLGGATGAGGRAGRGRGVFGNPRRGDWEFVGHGELAAPARITLTWTARYPASSTGSWRMRLRPSTTFSLTRRRVCRRPGTRRPATGRGCRPTGASVTRRASPGS